MKVPYGATVSVTDTALGTAVLTGRRLVLRPWELGDVASVAAAMSHPVMHRFLSIPDPYTEADAMAYVRSNVDATIGELGRAMVDRVSGQVVGSIAMRPRPRGPHHGSVELGYAVYPDAQGQGYAAEAVGLVVAHSFAAGFLRVELECAVDNVASAKTALNAGFRYEGMLRNGLRVRDGMVESALFGRLPTDPDGPTKHGFPALPEGGLTDGVIRLRGIDARDGDAFHEQESDADTVRYGFTGVAPDLASARASCTRAPLDWLCGAIARIAIEDLATARFAGSLSLRHPGPPGVGGIGYVVHPAFRGRCVTARALRLLAPWAFDSGYGRLELGAKSDNVASQRAAASGGFEPDGTRIARLRNPDGSYSDEVRFAIVSPAVRPQTARRISP